MPTSVVASSTTVPTFNRFRLLDGHADAPSPSTPPTSAPEPSPPMHVGNAPRVAKPEPQPPVFPLSKRERAVLNALLRSGADEAPRLIETLIARLAGATDPDAREAITVAFEQAVAARGYDVTTLQDLLLNIASGELGRMTLRTLTQAAPTVGSLLAISQVANAVRTRSWKGVATAVTALAPLLPALRSIDELDALVLSLPTALRSQLASLHQWVQQTDDALTPDLRIEHVGPALAVAAVLWHLQHQLPTPSRQLQGLGRFIAELPGHWRQLASLGGIGGTLFAPVPRSGPDPVGPDGVTISKVERLTKQDKAERIAVGRWSHPANEAANHGQPAPVISSLQSAPRDADAPDLAVPLQDWTAPGQVQRGGPIAPPPDAPLDAASSPASTLLGSWWTWLTGGVVAGFSQVAQSDPQVFEMIPLGDSPDTGGPSDVTVQTPLVGQAAVAAAGDVARRGTGFLRRNPLVAAVAGTLAAAGAAGGWAYSALRPSPPGEPTTTDVADTLLNEVVSVDGNWGTGLDLLLGTPELPGQRRKRHVSNTFESTPAPTPDEGTGQLGISMAQRDALLADNTLRGHLRSLQVLSLAVAQDIAARDGWQWVATLPASEQELLVNQLHVLRGLEPTLAGLQSMPQSLLDEALHAAGWTAGAAGITVDLGATRVAGVEVQQRMPLLEYCLLRADGTRPPSVDFSSTKGTLTAPQQKTLLDFVGSRACRQLQERVVQRSDALRPVLVNALRSRLIVDAIKAKSQGALGSGDVYLRGADIVLGFLQGATDVESSALTYTDTLADGTRVSIRVPNYLLLRSASSDAALHGQVVLYRSDLARFQSFDSEAAFRQFLDAHRAQGGLHVVNGVIDRTLADDIVAAATPAQRSQVRERVKGWAERQALFQAGKTGNQAWNARDSFVLDFQPGTAPSHTLADWAAVLIGHGQRAEQQQLEANRLRWTPLGIANAAAEAAYTRSLQQDLQSLQDHARPTLTTELLRALGAAGVTGDLQGFDPDKVQLKLDGRQMSLTEWALVGWQQHGLTRPTLPETLGYMPDAGLGLPPQHLVSAPWPGASELAALDLTAYRGGAGTRALDDHLTRRLQNEDARRAICTVLADLSDSNRLADDYIGHLKRLAIERTGNFRTAVADQIRTHTRWMIEVAHQHGRLDDTTFAALKAAHDQLEPSSGRPSSLKGVTLNGHAIHGLWALQANGRHYVFLSGTEAGDQLLDESAFRAWLQRPEAEGYVMAHAAIRHHADLEAMFRRKQSSSGITLGFDTTRGPQQAATDFIDARVSDVDEMTVSQLERFTQGLTIFGSVLAAVSCTLTSGGTLAALCVTSTLALLAKGIHDGVDLLERGSVHVDDAIETIGGSVIDLLDVLSLAAVPAALFRVGRQGLETVTEAGKALRTLQNQARRFDGKGRINDAFDASTQSLRDSGLPMQTRTLPAGGEVFEQAGHQYLKLEGDRFVEVTQDADDVWRLREPGTQAGAPVEYREGQWQRQQQRSSAAGGTTPRAPNGLDVTTPPSVQNADWVARIPEAHALPEDRLQELETVFGIRRPGSKLSADLRQNVRDLAMEDRIRHVTENPTSLGLPGDEAIILRAWADSPALGNGASVETYTLELDEWNRGARFGSGKVGLMVEVDDPRHLPGIPQLIDASNTDALRSRLKLPADSSDAALHDAVRDELARVIARNPAQSLLTWQRWSNMQHRLPTAADNLVKHFPQLTKSEAEALVNDNPVLAFKWQDWDFNGDDERKVAGKIAERNMRQTRQSVLAGRFDSPSKVMELTSHLQDLLPGRTWRVTNDPSGRGNVLTFTRPGDKENPVRSLTFDTGGGYQRPGINGGTQPVSSWEQGIFEQLSPSGKQSMPDFHALRTSVLEHMKDTPLISPCSLPRRPGKGKLLVERGFECRTPLSKSLTPEDIVQRDALGAMLDEVRTRMGRQHDSLSKEFAEYSELSSQRLAVKKEGKAMDETALARLHELEKKKAFFGDLKSFDIMNFASYEIDDLAYNGSPITLVDGFPTRGTAGSGNPRPGLGTEGLLEGAPVRRVFLPEEDAVGNPTFSGQYREDYALGADLFPVIGKYAENNQASKKITLTEVDLRVTRPGTKTKVPIHELSDEEILKLDSRNLSPNMRAMVGDAGFLPRNAKTLRPGDYRLYQIRSCSEGKILDRWFTSLARSVPEIGPRLWGTEKGTLSGLTGKVRVFSEMNLCGVSCDRRGEELLGLLPNSEFFYRFENNAARRDWWTNEKLKLIVRRNGDIWESEGVSQEQITVLAHAELLKPDVIKWVEEELRRNPPTQPVPQLWVPQDQTGL